MMTPARPSPPKPGDHAPWFALSAINAPAVVSLDDYRGRSALFLALFIGLWCPFCRRAIAQMAAIGPRVLPLGVQTLGVVATTPENAALYFKFRPTRVPLAVDPDLATHRAYGLPRPEATPDLEQAIAATRIDPYGDLPEPLPVPEAAMEIGRFDRYVETATDREDMERQWPMLKGQFLIDCDGIVRWTNIECRREGLAGIGKFPLADEVVAATRTLPP
jgi:peroxiredoxin